MWIRVSGKFILQLKRPYGVEWWSIEYEIASIRSKAHMAGIKCLETSHAVPLKGSCLKIMQKSQLGWNVLEWKHVDRRLGQVDGNFQSGSCLRTHFNLHFRNEIESWMSRVGWVEISSAIVVLKFLGCNFGVASVSPDVKKSRNFARIWQLDLPDLKRTSSLASPLFRCFNSSHRQKNLQVNLVQ